MQEILLWIILVLVVDFVANCVLLKILKQLLGLKFFLHARQKTKLQKGLLHFLDQDFLINANNVLLVFIGVQNSLFNTQKVLEAENAITIQRLALRK